TLDSLQHVNLTPLSSGFVGGNDPWAGFNLPGTNDILLTPTSDTGTLASGSDTLNTSSILLGVGGGQAVDQHEGMRIDFVNNLGGDPAKSGGNNNGYSDVPNRDHTFTSEYNNNGASVKMTSESPSGGATVTAAFKAYDDNDGDAVVYHDGTQEAITGITLTYLGVTYENPVTHVQMITPTLSPVIYTIGGHDFTVQLAADGKTVLVTGIEGDNGSSGNGTEIAVFTGNGYTSLEVINASTDSTASFKISSIGATVTTNDPVEFNLPVQIVDNDNDVSGTGNIHVTAGSASTLSAAVTTLGFKTALAPSNDNGGQKQTGTNTTVLTAALAAAGISSAHSAAAHGSDSPHFNHGDHTIEKAAGGNLASLMANRHEAHDRVDHGADTAKGGQHEAIVSRTPVHADQAQSQAHLGGEHHQAAQSELLQATAGPAHGGATDVAHVAAQGVIMPSAEQLAAACESAPQLTSVAGNQPQHNEVVGKVLADALQGGDGHAPNIEALVQSIGLHGPLGSHALEALASHGMEAVSNGHMAMFAGFAGGHGGLMMDPMIVHQDAAPAHG
ncbi:MAG: large repetitive protein, partial [Sphingomonadales bacterium]|nr:large repetitive protein [Sphingomonadales bacterium]